MKKLIQFDIEKAKSGKYGIVTRDGHLVEILSWNDTDNNERPIAAKTDRYTIRLWFSDGCFTKDREDGWDLFLMNKTDYDRYVYLRGKLIDLNKEYISPFNSYDEDKVIEENYNKTKNTLVDEFDFNF